jgi:hypothetical protein
VSRNSRRKSGLVKAFHVGYSAEGDWFPGTVRDLIVLLEYEDVTTTCEKDPKWKESKTRGVHNSKIQHSFV